MSSIKPPSLIRHSFLGKHLTKFLMQSSRIYQMFHLLNDTTLHANFDIVWDKNCVEFMSRKSACNTEKCGIKELKSYQIHPSHLIYE